jgi:hypothetical protein
VPIVRAIEGSILSNMKSLYLPCRMMEESVSENERANNVSIRLPEDDLNALSLDNPFSGFS